TVVSGTATITAINSANTTINVVAGSTATLAWTINNKTCADSVDTVILLNKKRPVALPVVGADTVCVNNLIQLTSGTTGVVLWSSSNTSIATIDTKGKLLAISEGEVFVSYVVIESDGCESEESEAFLITVTAEALGGIIHGDAMVCKGENTISLRLDDYEGIILRWESSLDDFTSFTTIKSTSSVLVISNITAKTSYRAIVSNGICDEVISAIKTVDLLLDTDQDGICDIYDLDDDNDGILDTVEGDGDTDGDGIPDSLDLDSDNDGILDVIESDNGNLDSDGDGQVDGPFGDNGFADNLEDEVDSGNPIFTPVDTDRDGKPDFQDVDSDNDGISDLVEGGTDPGLDTDGDGMIDDTYTDKDGNGIIDMVDPDNGGIAATIPDTDGDGVPDYRDLDSDNDGINDIEEAGLEDKDGNGLVDEEGELVDGTNLPDEDNDGIPDVLEPNNPNLSYLIDKDNDGVVDGIDSDGDGIIDAVDGAESVFGDTRDSIVAGISTITIPNTFTPNDDGVNDTFEVGQMILFAPNFSMEIRNRYGNLVYQYKHNGDIHKEPRWWDGYSTGRMTINKNEKVPDGTYFYVIKFNNEKTKPKVGWLYVSR
ncbi:MAG: hypothetical protein COB98_11690, partial [Flavobacteriaceae bacterium]